MTQLIKNPYNERMKEYEKLMQTIARFERGQQWSALYTEATKMAGEMLELKHKIAECKSNNELYM
jgi:hypothetical protein